MVMEGDVIDPIGSIIFCILAGIVIILFVLFVGPTLLGAVSIIGDHFGIEQDQPAPGYGQTYLFGGSWAGDMIRNHPYFINDSLPSTLRLVNVGEPCCSSTPFTYMFLYNGTNGSVHTAVVYIGQDAGSWKNGPFFDSEGWEYLKDKYV